MRCGLVCRDPDRFNGVRSGSGTSGINIKRDVNKTKVNNLWNLYSILGGGLHPLKVDNKRVYKKRLGHRRKLLGERIDQWTKYKRLPKYCKRSKKRN